MTLARNFAECSFNFFIIMIFAFFLDCWISFSKPDKLSVFPDIFERRFVAIRSKITVFLFWKSIINLKIFIHFNVISPSSVGKKIYFVALSASIYMKFAGGIYERFCSVTNDTCCEIPTLQNKRFRTICISLLTQQTWNTISCFLCQPFV